MAYDVFNTCMLVPGVNTSNCASWVQAWGTLFAVLGSAAVATYQANRQHRTAMRAIAEQSRERHLEALTALVAIAESNRRLVERIAGRVNTREALHETAALGIAFEEAEIVEHQRRFDAIPLHQLPPLVVVEALALAGTLRYFMKAVRDGIEWGTRMNGEDFAEFAETVTSLQFMLVDAQKHVRDELRRLVESTR